MSNDLQQRLEFLDELSKIEKDKPVQYVLRDYQEIAVQKGVEHLKSGKKPGVIVAPMGAGKSLIIANIAKNLDDHVIVFQPSLELLHQNRSKFLSYNTGITNSIFSASAREKIISQVTFVTIGSVYKNPSLFKKFKYIIVDECDGGIDGYNDQTMYGKFFSALGDKRIVGTTASPFRAHRNSFGTELRWITRQRPRFFHEIIYYVQIQQLFDEGYLCPCEYYSVKGFDINRLKRNSTNQDFTDDSMKKYFNDIRYDNSILDVAKRLINKRKNLLVFTKFVEEATILARELGDIAAVVSAKTPMQERQRIINDFKSGNIKICANASLLGIGFDFPELETVLMARPTLSMRIWMQFLGRAIRPHILKESAWLVDMADNLGRFPALNDIWIKKDAKNQLAFFDKKNNKQLTNVYL